MPPQKNNSKKNQPRLIILYILGLILAISSALPAYIHSNFLQQFVSLKFVSLFFISANIVSVVAIILFPKLIKNLSNQFLTKVNLIAYAVSLLGMTITDNALAALITTILFTVSSNLIWINMDILIESFSINSSTGKTRTIYFTFINAGWILSPSLAAYLISRGEYNLTFLVAAALTVPFLLIFAAQKNRLQDKIRYSKERLTTTIKKMWLNQNLRGIFFIALLLQLFYSAAVVYIPVYLHHNLGMDWASLGLLFSLMLIPFMVLEIPAGLIADKYWGEKEILAVGIFILAVSLFLFYYINTPSLILWGAALFLSRIGAALVEAMRETYFFKIIDAKDIGYINIFRLTAPLGYIIGPGIAILVISFLPLNYLFFFMSLVMLSGLIFLNGIKDTK